jgi:hypothetical protein
MAAPTSVCSALASYTPANPTTARNLREIPEFPLGADTPPAPLAMLPEDAGALSQALMPSLSRWRLRPSRTAFRLWTNSTVCGGSYGPTGSAGPRNG